MKKLILLLLFIPFVSFGQDYGNDSDALKLCTAIQTNSFISDSKADNALDRILSVIGASKRFVLQPCGNINNAVATSYKGIRYILYDRDFMDSLDSGDNWSNLFILAHEVGHHINGHSLDILLYAAEAVEPETLANQRKQELEADEFAGFILGKLGATLKQTSSGVNLISAEKDDTYDTHPSKSKRLASIELGFNKAIGKETVVYETPTKLQTAEEYFYDGLNKYNIKDYYGAIAAFNKVIELNPNLALAYINRAATKYNLKDYYGAIADDTKAIELNPNNPIPYSNRASAKSDLGDQYGSIADYNKAIELKPKPRYYSNRGVVKSELGDRYGAIADYTKAIELNSNFSKDDSIGVSEAYWNRCLEKFRLGDNNGACRDARNALKLGNNAATRFINNECN